MACTAIIAAYYYQGDLRPTFRVTLERNGAPIDVSTATSVTMRMWRHRDSAYSVPVLAGLMTNVTDGTDGLVEYTPTGTDFDLYGRFDAAFVIDWGSSLPETVPDEDFVTVAVHPAKLT